MEAIEICEELKQFHGTAEYYKHLFPGKSPILLTEGFASSSGINAKHIGYLMLY
jgi:hypothetical protein